MVVVVDFLTLNQCLEISRTSDVTLKSLMDVNNLIKKLGKKSASGSICMVFFLQRFSAADATRNYLALVYYSKAINSY